MAQSPNLRFYDDFSSKDKPLMAATSTNTTTEPSPDNVKGWLMNLHSYRETDTPSKGILVDADNNRIPTEIQKSKSNGRPESIASEDSVNLDELINANFTADMDDETDLPDLADLDLDDSTEDFWKLDNNDFLSNADELDWNPSTPTTITSNPSSNKLKSSMQMTPSSEFAARYKKNRSDSLSSDNSLTSQSTITQYAKYGLTPMIHPSESTSTSSRSLSRLSNYSTASSSTTSGIPKPRNSSNTFGGIPTPSRSSSNTLSPPGSTKPPRTQLVKRASHIPAPKSHTATTSPVPTRTISSSSGNQLNKKKTSAIAQQRASHIPTVRESLHRPGSPLNGRSSQTPSRIGMRSPTPGGPRNSLFNATESNKQKSTQSSSPTTTRPSGLRPPGTTNARSMSRIGTVNKS